MRLQSVPHWRSLDCTRSSSVSRPFSTTQALNGEAAGPVWRSHGSICSSMNSLFPRMAPSKNAALTIHMFGRGINRQCPRPSSEGLLQDAASRRHCRPQAARRLHVPALQPRRYQPLRAADWMGFRSSTRSGWFRQRALPGLEIAAIHKLGFDAIARQNGGADMAARSKQCACGDDTVARCCTAQSLLTRSRPYQTR